MQITTVKVEVNYRQCGGENHYMHLSQRSNKNITESFIPTSNFNSKLFNLFRRKVRFRSHALYDSESISSTIVID